MADSKDIKQLPNRDYIEHLRDLAYYISRLWGREISERTKQEPDGFGDYREYTLCDYRYKDEKIIIQATSSYGTSCVTSRVCDDDLTVKIGLSAIKTVVFSCTAHALHAYRPGAWEKYMLSMEDAVQVDQERIRQRTLRWANREENRFAPIDDSDLF